MTIYTKESLIDALRDIAQRGWIENARHGNTGGIGNTLEDLLGISENNLPIPNAAEWELKTQRAKTTALTTLFHLEPSPRAIKFVPQIFLLKYGWKHQQAGKKYPDDEKSFRQTIHGLKTSDRGFRVDINRAQKKVLVSFDSTLVAKKHQEWLNEVQKNIGMQELDPQPYWGFDDLSNKVGTKLLNCFYVQAVVKKVNGVEFYKYNEVYMLQKFSFKAFLHHIEQGNILIDFDARTGHNHGTKFRMRKNCFIELYEIVVKII